MAKCFLENGKTWDVSNGYVKVRITVGPGYDYEHTFSAGDTALTFQEIIEAINNTFTGIGGAYQPLIDIDNYETPTIVRASDTSLVWNYSELYVEDNAILQLLLGCYNTEQSTLVDWSLTDVSAFPYWSMARLPDTTVSTALDGTIIRGGFDNRQAYEEKQAGEDFVSPDGAESSPYLAIGGFNFDYKVKEENRLSLNLFMKFAVSPAPLTFVNDTYLIGNGYTYNLLVHRSSIKTLYSEYGVFSKNLTLLNTGEYAV